MLDTCVLSEMVKPQPNPGLVAWLRGQKADTLFICSISLGELRKGIDRMPVGKKRHDLTLWLMGLTRGYEGRFLDFDSESALAWGALSANLESAGTPMPVIDAMLAACAMRHGCTLVTRNERDYQRAGAPILNPWSA